MNHLIPQIKTSGYCSYINRFILAGFMSLFVCSGFAQSGTILVNSSSVAVSGSTKFPIWLSAGQTVNISTNISSISGILYNITASSSGIVIVAYPH